MFPFFQTNMQYLLYPTYFYAMTAVALNPTCVAIHVCRIIVVVLNSPVVGSTGLSVIINLSVRGKWHYHGIIPTTLH